MAAGDERRRSALIHTRIGRIRRRLNGERFLRELVVPLWCAATSIAIYRLLLRDHTWVFALVASAAAVAVWWTRARRTRVSAEQAAILLDRAADAGGLVLTRMELPVGEWELKLNERVRAAPLPEVRFARSAGLVTLALVFLLAALAVPLPKRIAPVHNAAAATKVAQVEARAQALADAVPLDQGVEAELARLREELEDGRFDAPDWEAADHLDSALAQKAAEAAAALAKAQQAADALDQAMGKAQSGDSASRERDELERALMNLDSGAKDGEDVMQRALAKLGEGQGGRDSQSGDGQQGESGKQGDSGKQGAAGKQDGAGKQGQSGANSGQGAGKSPSRSQVQDLKRALAQRQQQLAKQYGQGNGGQRSAQSQSGQGQGQSGGQSSESGDGQGQGAGVSRGGGPGKLTFDNPNEVNPNRLAFAPLPEGSGGDEPGQLWGLRAVDPKASTEPSRGAAATGGMAQGEQAPGNDQGALLPRNRELIRRYFDSQKTAP